MNKRLDEFMHSTRLEQPISLLLMAAWFGLATGIAEVGNLAVAKLVRREFLAMGRAFVWMVPLAELLFMLVSGLVLALIALRWPRLASHRIAAFVFAFLGFMSLLRWYPQLHQLAALLLAGGLAAQTARAIAAHPRRFYALARRTLGWMGVLAATLGLAVHGERWWSESRALANLPAPPRGAANVLLVVLDTVRARSLGLYGYERPTTPNLERLAQTGVRFDRALSTSPYTLPSHASLFTGRWPHELSADWETALDDTHPTLAEILSERGYRTGGFSANTFYGSYEHGVDRGFAHYEDFQVSLGQLVASSSLGKRLLDHEGMSRYLRRLINIQEDNRPLGQKTAGNVNRDFLRWLDNDRERPFFAFLNYMEAHQPYDPPPPFDTRFGGISRRRSVLEALKSSERSPEEKQRLRTSAYDGSVAYMDQQLGELLEELRARGALDNTIVIVTSDHGEQFGEHGLEGHSNSLYMELLHVPLLISFPGRVPAGASVGEFVTLRDVSATVLDLLGMGDGIRLPGNSLARFWDGDRAPAEGEEILLSEVTRGVRAPPAHPTSRGAMTSLVKDGFHYIKNHGDGREELYDLEADPGEERNLAGSPEGRAALARFRAELELSLAPSGLPR